MIREELCQNAKVLGKLGKGSFGLCFTFHGMDVDTVFTHVDLELCILSQKFDINWCSVSVEEGAKAATSHSKCIIAAMPGDRMDCLVHSLLHGAAEGEGGLWNSNAPLLSKGLC